MSKLEPIIYIHRPLDEFAVVKLHGETIITCDDNFYNLEFSAMVEVAGDFERDKFIIEVIALTFETPYTHIRNTISGYHVNFRGHIKVTGKLYNNTIFTTKSTINVF